MWRRLGVTGTYHVFSTLHQLLADDLACIVFPSLDMDGLFDDRIRPVTEGLACTVLQTPMEISTGIVALSLCTWI